MQMMLYMNSMEKNCVVKGENFSFGTGWHCKIEETR